MHCKIGEVGDYKLKELQSSIYGWLDQRLAYKFRDKGIDPCSLFLKGIQNIMDANCIVQSK